MNCPERDILARFLRGELAPAEVGLLQVHLDECPDCFKRVALEAAGMSGSVAASSGWLGADPSRSVDQLSPTPRGDAGVPSAPIPTRVGPYAIEGELGRGGMGVVYRARDTRSGTAVALKTVRKATPAALDALRHEIKLLEEARHAGLVAILGHDITSGDPWYAMELLEGETLNERNRAWWGNRVALSSTGEYPAVLPAAGAGHLNEILTLFRNLCDPLDFVHRAGIVHCDVKPANVFVRRGEPILMDFGLAVQARGTVGRESLSLASRGRGTLPYMCPEVIQGKIPDARTDLYALGCMLYESVVGRPPFVALRRDDLLDQHLHATVVPASARASGVPEALDELILALLEKDPRTRLGEAARVAAVLDGLVAASGEARVPPRAFLYRPQLVGRDVEKQSLIDRAEKASQGCGSFVLLSGESGIGKTFFVNEVCQRAMLRGMRVVPGECEPPATSGVSQPHAARALHPFANFFNLLRDECARDASEGMPRLLGDFPNVLAAYSPALATLPAVRGAGAPAPLPDLAARERVITSLRSAVLELARNGPLLIALDDLQWADDLSLAFLDSLSPELLRDLPILVIATYRSDEATPALEALGAKPGVDVRSLKRLGHDSMEAMVGQMLGMTLPPPALVELVGQQSEGVPFFVAEYLRSALSESSLTFGDGAWRFDSRPETGAGSPSLSFPARLKELVRRRVGSLAPLTMSCVEIAAAVGREFEAAVLAEVMACDLPAVHANVTDAVQRGIVELSNGQRYRFAHDKFREVVYEDLGTSRQVKLHASIASGMESLFAQVPAELDDRAAMLARHFERGGQPERALEYLDLAGQRSLRVSANAEAVVLLKEAINVASRLPAEVPVLRRAVWERGIADALAGLGRVSESEQHLARAATLLGSPVATRAIGAVFQVGKELARLVARRFLPPVIATDTPSRQDLRLETARVYERVHRTAYYTGNAANVVVGALTSLNLWATREPGPELITAYAHTAQLCSVLPAHSWTKSYLEKANRALSSSHDPAAESMVRVVEGVYFMGLGESDSAIACIEQAIQLAERIGYHRRHEEGLAVRAGIDIFAGHWATAARFTAPLERSARARGDKQMLCWCLSQKLDCCLLSRDYARAQPLIAELDGLSPHLNDPERLWASGLSAYALVRLGQWDEAEAKAQAAHELVLRTPPGYTYCISAYDRLAETWVRLLDQRQPQPHAVEAWRAATKALTRSARAFPVAGPAALFHQGLIHYRRGRTEKAIRAWQQGLGRATTMELVHQEARLSQALAKTLDTDSQRAQLSRRASIALSKLDLPPDSDTSDSIPAPAPTPQLAM